MIKSNASVDISYLEVKSDGWLVPWLVNFKGCGCNFSTHHELIVSLEFLYSPHDSILIWLVLSLTSTCGINLTVRCIRRHRNSSNNWVCKVSFLKNCLNFDAILNSILLRKLLYNRDYLKRQVDVLWNTISHHLKYAIRRNKSDGSISVKFSKSHALMKFDIINLNTPILLLSIILNQQLVIDSKFAFRHTTESSLNKDLTAYLCSEHSASVG